MRLRTLALALALSCGVTGMLQAAAKKPKAQKSQKYKQTKIKKTQKYKQSNAGKAAKAKPHKAKKVTYVHK